jgi:hypothetical protein
MLSGRVERRAEDEGIGEIATGGRVSAIRLALEATGEFSAERDNGLLVGVRFAGVHGVGFLPF